MKFLFFASLALAAVSKKQEEAPHQQPSQLAPKTNVKTEYDANSKRMYYNEEVTEEKPGYVGKSQQSVKVQTSESNPELISNAIKDYVHDKKAQEELLKQVQQDNQYKQNEGPKIEEVATEKKSSE